MIPRVGKVERTPSSRSSTDNSRDSMSQSPHHDQSFNSTFRQLVEEELAKSEESQVDAPVKKLVLKDRIELSPEGRRLYELSKQDKQ